MVSPDGKWLAFMVNLPSHETGYGRGLGLPDLAAWDATTADEPWEFPEG